MVARISAIRGSWAVGSIEKLLGPETRQGCPGPRQSAESAESAADLAATDNAFNSQTSARKGGLLSESLM